MSEYIQVQWTCSGLMEAKKILGILFEKQLIACANIIPWVESYFTWKGKLELSQETKVLMKTKKEKFCEIEAMILENGSNEVPEILMIEIAGGHLPYLEWLEGELSFKKSD